MLIRIITALIGCINHAKICKIVHTAYKIMHLSDKKSNIIYCNETAFVL